MDQYLRGIMGTLSDLAARLARVKRQRQIPSLPAPVLDPPATTPVGHLHPRKPFVPAPEYFEGKLGECKSLDHDGSLLESARASFSNTPTVWKLQEGGTSLGFCIVFPVLCSVFLIKTFLNFPVVWYLNVFVSASALFEND